jgi:hypothetical protein
MKISPSQIKIYCFGCRLEMAIIGIKDPPPSTYGSTQPSIHWVCENQHCSPSGVPFKVRIRCDSEGLITMADAQQFKDEYSAPWNYGGRAEIPPDEMKL